MSLRGARLNGGGGGGGAPAGTGIVTVTGGVLGTPAPLSGDVSTTGGGVVATIANGAVSLAKMANLATARFIGRVTAGAGAPESLTGTQATTLLDVFTSLLKGLVPASGGGTANYLRADGSWAAPPGTFVSTNIGLGWFGSGKDGAAIFDGVSTVLGMVPTPGLTTRGVTYAYYVLTQDLYLTTGQVNANVALFTNGFRLFVKGTLTNNGLIGCWGDDGANGTVVTGGGGGAARTPTNLLGGSGAGGGGGTWSANGVGSAGGAQGASPRGFTNVNSGVGHGGNGGANNIANVGALAGSITVAGVQAGDMDNILQALDGHQVNSTNRFTGASGGGGGRGRDNVAGQQGAGGGGGAGGACAVVCALTHAGTGFIGVHGGNGGSGFGGAGGGGGGGGGWVVIVYGYGSPPTTNVTGGTGGTSSTGSAGSNGGNGLSYIYLVGA